MLVTNHVLQGALLGRALGRPVPAFLLGVASHFAADALPHWGGADEGVRDRAFLVVAVPDGLAGLLVMAAVASTASAEHRLPLLAGMFGAALPDADKPWALVTGGRAIWPGAVNRFHTRIQREAAHRLPLEVAGAGALALLYVFWPVWAVWTRPLTSR